jgi:hypothetical protein
VLAIHVCFSKPSKNKERKTKMNIMELGVIFVQFSNLPASQRETFLSEHREILNTGMVGWALTAARMREPEARQRLASAAFYIATKLGSTDQANEARRIYEGG